MAVRVPAQCTLCAAITGSELRLPPETRAVVQGRPTRCGECGGPARLAEGVVDAGANGHTVDFVEGRDESLTVWRRYAAGCLRLRVADRRQHDTRERGRAS